MTPLLQDGLIMITWANHHYLDFAKTWVHNLQKVRAGRLWQGWDRRSVAQQVRRDGESAHSAWPHAPSLFDPLPQCTCGRSPLPRAYHSLCLHLCHACAGTIVHHSRA